MIWFLICACSDKNETTIIDIEDGVEDIDGDGFYGDSDCDETNPNNYEGAIEICDGVDNNCDGQIDEGVQSLFYGDGDGDGFGNEGIVLASCSGADGFVLVGGDCDDADPNTYPGALEDCNLKDNNCNGVIDDGFNNTFYADLDQDGYGDPATTTTSCSEDGIFVGNALDCNDQNSQINPSASELCDDIDNNCDGVVDNAPIDARIFYQDSDGDGYGTEAETMQGCEPEPGYTAQIGDCDDADPLVYPYAQETCDERDENCNNLIDDGALFVYFEDSDGDGYGNFNSFTEACEAPEGYVANAQDCDDTRSDVSPDRDEYCDGLDNDCDALIDEHDAVDVFTWYADVDMDGYGDNAVPYQACNAPLSYVALGGDCDDGRPNVHPNALETCTTTYDDNCDGSNNDLEAQGCQEYHLDSDGDGYGVSADYHCICAPEGDYTALADGDCDDTLNTVHPAMMENCNTVYDDNCNGDTADIGAANCTYYYYDYDGDDYGTADRLCMCNPSGVYTGSQGDDCDDFDAAINPAAIEVCDSNTVDENCDGQANDALAIDALTWYIDLDVDGYGDTNGTPVIQCENPGGYVEQTGDCDDGKSNVHPAMSETCNTTYDDDCDGDSNDEGAIGCVDFYLDADGDGYGLVSDAKCLCLEDFTANYDSRTIGDCDDLDAGINPNSLESCASTDDEDCDGVPDEEGATGCTIYFYDYDGDGYGVINSSCLCASDGYYTAIQMGDCDDLDSNKNPAAGNCGLNGVVSPSLAVAVFEHSGTANSFPYFTGQFDYNRDGNLDIAIANTSYDTAYTNAGGVFLFLGPVIGGHTLNSNHDADLLFTPELANAYVGGGGLYGVNIDGDNFDELVFHGRIQQYYQSQIFILDDGLQSLGEISDQSTGVSSLDFGSNDKSFLSHLGDIDQDGADDFLGAYASSTMTFFVGDGAGGFITSTTVGSTCESHHPVVQNSKAIDFDGSGVSKWFRFCQGYTLHVYEGVSHTDTISSPFYTNDEHGRMYGYDLDRDGYEDIIFSNVTARVYTQLNGYQSSGRVLILKGSSSGVAGVNLNTPDLEFQGLEGSLVSSPLSEQIDFGDFNGDLGVDIIMGTEDGAFLYYGGFVLNGSVYDTSMADATFPNLKYGVKNIGDHNSDGYDDLLIGGSCTGTACGGYTNPVFLFHGGPN